MAGVYLVSGPVRSGKTTRLGAWCGDQADPHPGRPLVSADGILAPVVRGHRHLVRVATGISRDLESIPDGTATEVVRRYRFNAGVFAWARAGLRASAQSGAEWIVVDEIGPLELAGGGLEPAIGELFTATAALPTRIVLVIREHLVAEVLDYFRIPTGDTQPFPFA